MKDPKGRTNMVLKNTYSFVRILEMKGIREVVAKKKVVAKYVCCSRKKFRNKN